MIFCRYYKPLDDRGIYPTNRGLQAEASPESALASTRRRKTNRRTEK